MEINYVCRDNTGRVVCADGKKIWDFLVLVTDTLTIHKALEIVI